MEGKMMASKWKKHRKTVHGIPVTHSAWARHFANHSSATIMLLLAVHEGKTLPERRLIHRMGQMNSIDFAGFKLSSDPTLCLDENHVSSKDLETPACLRTNIHAVQASSEEDIAISKEGNSLEEKDPFPSVSLIRRELPESTLGWPLLGRNLQIDEAWRKATGDDPIIEDCNSLLGTTENESKNYSHEGKHEKLGLLQEVSSKVTLEATKESVLSRPGWPLLGISTDVTSELLTESKTRELSVVQWVMRLPNRSKEATTNYQIDMVSSEGENFATNESSSVEDRVSKAYPAAAPRKPESKTELLLKLNLFGCKLFSYEELKTATNQFSSENFIGEGGCSNVYRGELVRGKLVALKILKQYKEAWNDFSLEVDIMFSLKHKYIAPLIGVCLEDDYLILVYDFLSRGSLEESIQGHREKIPLPWKVRFSVALAIAEALNYLHNECSPPVIHRDVKSSNILLSDELHPQLSDFGLAVWGTSDSTHLVTDEIVGTFGYIAPEYFMQGKVSDKVDVYSFGIVLLELLTGRKPIDFKAPKGQESLVKWAMALLQGGNLKELLDPRPDADSDIVQIRRMVLAAALCIQQSARLRPKLSQILALLKGEKEETDWRDSYIREITGSTKLENDDLGPELEFRSFSESVFSDTDDDAGSLCSRDTKSTNSVKRKLLLKDFLLEQQN